MILNLAQLWLTHRIHTLYPHLDEETVKGGVCVGLAHMAKQAFLVGDLKSFEKRQIGIKGIPLDTFSSEIEALKQKQVNIINLVKEEINDNKSLFTAEKTDLLNLPSVQKKIAALEALACEERFTKEAWIEEINRRKESILFNAFLQKKIIEKQKQLENSNDEKKRKLALSEMECINLEIHNFFEGIVIQQNLLDLQFMHSLKLRKQSVQSDPLFSALTNSLILEEEGGADKMGSFSGAYTKEELHQFFNEFQQSFDSNPLFTKPIVFLLSSMIHTIMIGYDPVQKNWVFVDAENWEVPTPRFDSNGISEKVLAALTKNDVAVFATEIYAHCNNEKMIKECLSNWEQKEIIKEMHTVSLKKAFLTDFVNAGWIHVATRGRENHTVEKLLKYNPNPNLSMCNGMNPLILAAHTSNETIIDMLIANGVNPNLKNKFDIVALYGSILNEDEVIVEKLLNHGADPNITVKNSSLLAIAVSKQNSKIVEMLLSKNADPNVVVQGYPLIHLAVYLGNLDIVEQLLKKGANPNVILDGASPLLTAIDCGRSEIVAKLLENGADPNFFHKGYPAIYFAVSKGHTQIVEHLLKKGATANFTKDNDTLLGIAINSGDVQTALKLLEYGANPEENVAEDWSPLLFSIEQERKEIVIELLKRADVNAATKTGLTPIFMASMKGNKDIVKMLLAKGALVSIVFKGTSRDLEEVAKQYKVEQEMKNFINDYKSKNSIYSEQAEISMTPKDIAHVMGHKEIVNELVLHESKKKRKIDNISIETPASQVIKPFSF